MAEIVEMRMEDSIPDLEEMEKTKIFGKDEIKKIVKKRKEFEYRIKKPSKCKEDYVHYIDHELNLLKVVRIRKLKNNIPQQRRIYVEYLVANRINRLYNEMIRKYQEDVNVWLYYVRFCKQVRFYSAASRVFHQLLELHGKKRPMLYKLASNWELKECNCIEKARMYLLNGLHVHKDSSLLYKEIFKLELHNSNEKRTEALANNGMLDETDSVIQGEQALIIYQSAVKVIPEITFLVELFHICQQFDFTAKIQNNILSDMKTLFPKEEITWDTVAKNELTCRREEKLTYKQKMRLCVDVYKTQVKELKTEKMWSMFIDTLLEFYKDTSTGYPNFKRNILSNGLTGAHLAGKLEEKYYFFWVENLNGADKSKALNKILQQATKRLRHSVQLWELRLKRHLYSGEEEMADVAFKEGCEILGPNSVPLWKLMLLYYQSENSDKVDEIFKVGILHPNGEVSGVLRTLYLERLAVTKGIKYVRSVYEKMCKTPPINMELHRKMITLEGYQPESNEKYIRSCYKLARRQFGTNNTDVWMDSIKFELKHGNTTNVQAIYNEAINTLNNKSLVDNFISEYNLEKSNSTL